MEMFFISSCKEIGSVSEEREACLPDHPKRSGCDREKEKAFPLSQKAEQVDIATSNRLDAVCDETSFNSYSARRF